MREIKFRVWNSDNKEFISQKDFHLITIRFDGLPQFFSGDYVTIHGKFWPEHLVLQQYTGIKDKNGREIYEGDIIMNESDHDNAAMCVVGWSVYEEIGWSLYYPFREPMEPLKQNFNGIDLYEEYPLKYGGPCYEVIGNIYENSDLIK